MITNKFSFNGALGKSQNLGASKFLSVPNTIEVPPEYSLETDVPSVAEFLTSSLNGRLWIFRRSRRFYLAVLRWNEDTQRLVFVTSSILSNENLIMRGVDWILTDKSFIQSSDDEPYFSRTVYETDDTSYIDAIHRSYSFFPEFETWEEIHNASIHIQNPPSDKFKEIPRDVLTLIEFHYYMDDDVRNNKKSINVNKIFNNTKENHYIEWDNIYKFPVHFDFVNTFQFDVAGSFYSSYFFSSSPLIFYSKPCEYHSYAVQKKITNETYTGEKIYNHWEGEFDVIASRTYSLSIVDGTDYYDSFTAEFIYIDLDSGTPRTINCSAQLPQISIDSYDFDGTMKYGLEGLYITPCHFHDEHISHSESFSNYVYNYDIHASVPRPIFIDNSIVFQVNVCDYSHTVDLSSIYGELTSSTSHYEKVADFSSYNWNIIDESVKYNFYLTDMQDSYLVFTEKRSNLTFLINTPQSLQDMINLKKAYSRGTFNFYKSQDILTNSNGEKYILKCTHVCWIYNWELNSHYLIILRSEYNPDIFDFDSEIERSKLF